MNRALWVNQRDTVKLILVTLVMIPFMLVAVSVAGTTADNDLLFPVVGLIGMAICAGAAYWLGNWKWILIPVLAMLVEIAVAIPAVIREPTGGETPISIVLEAPFWTGLPALVGAGIGYLIKRVHAS